MDNLLSEYFNTLIVGGGPAGMMAAIAASGGGNSVCILEKNQMLGRKLRITGKGRCNITNDCDFDTLMSNIPENNKFLYSSFKNYSNKDIIDFFNENGCPTVTERGNRVFPQSSKAIDVVNVLKKQIENNKISVYYKSNVVSVLIDEGEAKGAILDDGRIIRAKNVVIATGGISYPLTGSTGDGYEFAKAAGHSITAPKASLIRLTTKDKSYSQLSGLSLKNISIRFTLDQGNSKELYKDFGEMLFTGDGISGPVVLSASRHLLKYDYKGITAHIDLKPALTEEKLDARITRDFGEFSRKQLKNSLGELLPKSLIPVIIRKAGLDEEKFVNQITKEERRALAETIKNLQVSISGCGPVSEAIVTSGGIKVNEINPKTMESKLCKNLYFAGEVIDVDGYTGGFNLTIAFSTGRAAGRAIKEKENKNEA